MKYYYLFLSVLARGPDLCLYTETDENYISLIQWSTAILSAYKRFTMKGWNLVKTGSPDVGTADISLHVPAFMLILLFCSPFFISLVQRHKLECLSRYAYLDSTHLLSSPPYTHTHTHTHTHTPLLRNTYYLEEKERMNDWVNGLLYLVKST